MAIVAEKISQTAGILDELDLDLWLVFVRETRMLADPVCDLVVGHDVTWQSFFAFTRAGRSIALVGNFDRDIFTRDGYYGDVRTYTEGVGESIRRLLRELDPSTIAVNYSIDNPAADGLTHGMYLALCEYMKNTPHRDRLVSAQAVCSALRSRKTPTEIACLTAAAAMAVDVWNEAGPQIAVGMSERDVAAVVDGLIHARGAKTSFETAVNAGDKTSPGHGLPTDARLAHGDLMHIDFGVELDGYCSDLQRLIYFRRPGEASPPGELSDAFETVNRIITETARVTRPGARGCEIDALARSMLRDEGYPAYEHALGHQLGRSVHDGGAIIGPEWERYGSTPMMPLEENNVFTLELEILLPGIGCVGLEEDVRVTGRGAEFLCPRQVELIIR
ncbi:MAG: Xaa-Pro peptidase family protein [candidate division Zixibacteria bacterium]|jgi:Xaa-Pro aminopeptidase|nr:Xaa-Pro peptidase family protein [candidate division Zixibacteria bacterium]